ncbi:metal-sensing transcriptional repressor [Candidatus Woesebacteria bacterium]|nr:metal-sensing transcriptional repressor [Candidatus Woesebacteria bacterium]
MKRLRIAQGHLKKVEEMLAGGDYCPDIIHQNRAVQAALKKVDEIILHGHLHTCVLNDIHGSKNKNEKFIKEIVELFGKNGR